MHVFGDNSNGRTSAGCKNKNLSDQKRFIIAHFNPTNQNHGAPSAKERHVGDLGNIEADKNGVCKTSFTDHLLKLSGDFSVVG